MQIEEREQILSFLAEELIKTDPKTDMVKECMQKIGLEYSDDPVERINIVLQALHFSQPDKTIVDSESDKK